MYLDIGCLKSVFCRMFIFTPYSLLIQTSYSVITMEGYIHVYHALIEAVIIIKNVFLVLVNVAQMVGASSHTRRGGGFGFQLVSLSPSPFLSLSSQFLKKECFSY